MAELDGIYNFLALSPSMATAGQPTEDELAAVKAAGFEGVINLLTTTSPYALPEEGRIISRLGLKYVHIPVDWDNPAAADAERFFDVMDAFGLRRLALFGSVARDEAGPDSDVDVLVEFEGRATLDQYAGLYDPLEDLPDRPVDLVTGSAVRPSMRASIEEDSYEVQGLPPVH